MDEDHATRNGITRKCRTKVNQAIRSIKEGAVEFFTKPVDPDHLMRTIHNAFEKLSQRKLVDQELDKLSYRERQALGLFVRGYSNPDVADELGIKISTVKEYKANIFRKLDAEKISEHIKEDFWSYQPDARDTDYGDSQFVGMVDPNVEPTSEKPLVID